MHSRYTFRPAFFAAVGYSPSGFFALSRLLIDRSRRNTLHTLHVTPGEL